MKADYSQDDELSWTYLVNDMYALVTLCVNMTTNLRLCRGGFKASALVGRHLKKCLYTYFSLRY